VSRAFRVSLSTRAEQFFGRLAGDYPGLNHILTALFAAPNSGLLKQALALILCLFAAQAGAMTSLCTWRTWGFLREIALVGAGRGFIFSHLPLCYMFNEFGGSLPRGYCFLIALASARWFEVISEGSLAWYLLAGWLAVAFGVQDQNGWTNFIPISLSFRRINTRKGRGHYWC
jgi:hypothetical protein